jgi:hypothetical protein
MLKVDQSSELDIIKFVGSLDSLPSQTFESKGITSSVSFLVIPLESPADDQIVDQPISNVPPKNDIKQLSPPVPSSRNIPQNRLIVLDDDEDEINPVAPAATAKRYDPVLTNMASRKPNREIVIDLT